MVTKCKEKARPCHADWKCSVHPDGNKCAMCCDGDFKQDMTLFNLAGTASDTTRKMQYSFSHNGIFKSNDFEPGAFELFKTEFKRALITYSSSKVVGYGAGELIAYNGPTYVKVSVDDDDDDNQYLQLHLKCDKDSSSNIWTCCVVEV